MIQQRVIRRLRLLIDERCIGVVDNLHIAVVFHHDDPDMVQPRHGERMLRTGGSRHDSSDRSTGEQRQRSVLQCHSGSP